MNRDPVVEQVRETIDIVALVAETVELTKQGDFHSGLCPLHADKDPSLRVWEKGNNWKCFGCGESGDCFTWIEKREGIGFREALEILGKRAGLEIQSGPKDDDWETHVGFFHEALLKNESVLARLLDPTGNRGYTMEPIKGARLGYRRHKNGAGYITFPIADTKTAVAKGYRAGLVDRKDAKDPRF